jgi:hypothetical protein
MTVLLAPAVRRRLPGRQVGISKDYRGRAALASDAVTTAGHVRPSAAQHDAQAGCAGRSSGRRGLLAASEDDDRQMRQEWPWATTPKELRKPSRSPSRCATPS